MASLDEIEEFCEVFTTTSGHVINPIKQTAGGWLCDLKGKKVIVADEEIADFPGSSEGQKQEIVASIFVREGV